MFSKIDSIEYYLPKRKKFSSKNFNKIYDKTGILNTRVKKKIKMLLIWHIKQVLNIKIS